MRSARALLAAAFLPAALLLAAARPATLPLSGRAGEPPREAVRLRLESGRPAASGERAWDLVAITETEEEVVLEVPVEEGTLDLRLRLRIEGAGRRGVVLRWEADGRLREDENSWRSWHRSLSLLYGEPLRVPLYDSSLPGRRLEGTLTAAGLVSLSEEAPPLPLRLHLRGSLVQGEGSVLSSLGRVASVGEEVLFPIRGRGPGRWAEVEVHPVLLVGEDLYLEVVVRWPAQGPAGFVGRQISEARVLGPRDVLVLDGLAAPSGEGIRFELAWSAERPGG